VRKLLCLLLALSLLLAFAACAGKGNSTADENTDTGTGRTQANQPAESTPAEDAAQDPAASADQTSTQSSTSYEEPDTGNEELLQSASVDLDADGASEQVAVLQAEVEDPAQPGTAELAGILRIDDKKGSTDIVFIKKPKGVTGVMNAIEFRDLDRDGIKDVFITIPDAGAAFNLNYYFIYNYANGKSFKFNTDAALSDFAGGFQFIYKGKGILQASNDSYGFSADFDITGRANGPDDEINSEYERAWVEATPVEIGENSKIGLRALSGGQTEIKVPLPVFGLATADMIGEIDMYFSVGADFTPVMNRFEVMDFNEDMSMKKIGEWKRP
jgi:hypothetical protein